MRAFTALLRRLLRRRRPLPLAHVLSAHLRRDIGWTAADDFS